MELETGGIYTAIHEMTDPTFHIILLYDCYFTPTTPSHSSNHVPQTFLVQSDDFMKFYNWEPSFMK